MTVLVPRRTIQYRCNSGEEIVSNNVEQTDKSHSESTVSNLVPTACSSRNSESQPAASRPVRGVGPINFVLRNIPIVDH